MPVFVAPAVSPACFGRLLLSRKIPFPTLGKVNLAAFVLFSVKMSIGQMLDFY
jgi:hypothetical protein